MNVKKIAITEKKRIYPILDLNRSLHINEGAIDREELIAHNHEGIIQTTTGEKLLFLPATFKDNYARLKRKAAVMIPKDIGFIIAETGLTKESVVLESGSGSGFLTTQLAALCKKVYTFDIEPSHVKIVKENCEALDLDNVVCEIKDIKDVEIPELADIAIFDLPDARWGLPIATKYVKNGGFIVFYTPQINQVQDLVNALGEEFKYLRTIELIQRDWVVDELKLRPAHNMLGHTAFLTVIRLFKRD